MDFSIEKGWKKLTTHMTTLQNGVVFFILKTQFYENQYRKYELLHIHH